MIVPDEEGRRTEFWVVYDLADAEQWTRAGEDRRAWGRGMSQVFTLDTDHIVIVFRPGGATGLEASA